jgi:hypothetical protein
MKINAGKKNADKKVHRAFIRQIFLVNELLIGKLMFIEDPGAGRLAGQGLRGERMW